MSSKRLTRKLVAYFINGVIVILPLALVTYVVYQCFLFLDNLLGRFIRKEIADYVPGLGLLITVVLITFVGMIASSYVSKWLLEWIEGILTRIPFIKTLYSIVKETIQSLLGEKKAFSKVALVSIPGSDLEVLGFITNENIGSMLGDYQDHVAVYLPQSFQMAGMTVFVPRSRIKLVDMSVEAAMSFLLSAGVSSSAERNRSRDTAQTHFEQQVQQKSPDEKSSDPSI